MTLYADLYHRGAFSNQRFLDGLGLYPRTISADWHGGYKMATIDVAGTNAADMHQLFDVLRCGVRIYNNDGGEVWVGLVWAADITIGERSYSISLDDTYNRVRVGYVALGEDGSMESYDSDWSEDAYSQEVYGVREVKRNMSDEADADLANQRAALELDLAKLPIPSRGDGDGSYSAQLHCVGLIKEIDDLYYENTPGGRTEYEPGGTVTHPLGWETTDTQAGFSDNGETGIGGYSSFAEKLPPGAVNLSFIVTGTSGATNDGTYTVTERVAEENVTLDTTNDGAGFRWDAGGTYLVEPATEGLNVFGAGQIIDVDITTDATGYFGYESGPSDWGFEGLLGVREDGTERIKCDWDSTRSASDFDHDQGDVDDHPSTLDGTVTGAAFVRITPKPAADEHNAAGATYTIKTSGWRVAQQVNIPVGGGGYLWKVAIPLSKVGSPSDTVRVSVWEDSGGSFGAMVDEGWITASEVGTTEAMRWCVMDNAGTNSISDSTSYHIVVERTGSHDPDNYWLIGVVEETADGDASELYEESARFYNGSTWEARARDCSLPFRVWTGEDVADQVVAIIDEMRTAISGVEAADKAGILVSPYADGERRGLDVVRSLLEYGYNDGQGMILEIVSGRRALVRKVPTSTAAQRVRIGPDGQLQTAQGGPLSTGHLIVGEWAKDVAAPPPVSTIASMSPVLISECEYDAQRGKYRYNSPGRRDPFDMSLNNA